MIWFWKKSTCLLFSCLTFSFSVSCASPASPICSAARWEIQMYSSRLSMVRMCVQRSRSFLQKSFNAADGKNFFPQEHTFKISAFSSDYQQNVQNMRRALIRIRQQIWEIPSLQKNSPNTQTSCRKFMNISFCPILSIHDYYSHISQTTRPSEPPKFPATVSTIEVEEKPEEPLEWYLLGLRYLPVLATVLAPTYSSL